MYDVRVTTTEGPKSFKIADITKIEEALAPYRDIYISFTASQIATKQTEALIVAPCKALVLSKRRRK